MIKPHAFYVSPLNGDLTDAEWALIGLVAHHLGRVVSSMPESQK